MTCTHQWHDATTAAGPEWVCSKCGMKYSDTKLTEFIAASKLNPTKREWVGLTDAEAQWIYDNARTPSGMIEMTEAKLMEKNT